MTKTTYILDSNVFVNAAKHCYLKILGEQDKQWGWKLKRDFNFIKHEAKNIKILDLVLSEFLGVYMQKEIDFYNYNIWYQNRLAAMGQVSLLLQKQNYVNIKDSPVYLELFTTAFNLTSHKLNAKLINKCGYEKEKNITYFTNKLERAISPKEIKKWTDALKRHKSIYSNKIFDGIDGIITAYAMLYANANKNEDVIIVTDDRSLITAISCYQKNKLNIGNDKFPANLQVKQS